MVGRVPVWPIERGNTMKKKLMAILATLTMVVGLVVAQTSNAFAYSDSRSLYYPSTGATITANIWLPNTSGNGCFMYTSSATINKTPNWIKETVTFTAHGIAASVHGVGFSGGSGAQTMSWQNSGGARGSYLSGEVCTSWTTYMLTASTAASSLIYGVLENVTTMSVF